MIRTKSQNYELANDIDTQNKKRNRCSTTKRKRKSEEFLMTITYWHEAYENYYEIL